MKLSIPMMVKNESRYLEQVLSALQPIRDAIETELIIVDTGSEDNTVEIAKKFTDKVFFHPWNNDFSEMRNITLSYAMGEWLLMIDGDEVLDNPQPIIDFLLSKESSKVNTGLVTIKNIVDENDEGGFANIVSPRIFRNRADFKFKGAIHNQPAHIPPYREIMSTLVHYGYISTDKELMERKFKRTGDILKRELDKNPENIYYWYQLSVTYAMHKDYNLAVGPAEKAYELVKKNHNIGKSYMYVFLELIKAYMNVNKLVEAEGICDEAYLISSEYIDLHFFAGKVKLLRKKYEEAAICYESYLDTLSKFETSDIKKDISVIHYTLGKAEDVYADLSLINYNLKNYRDAIIFFDKISKIELKSKNRNIFLESCMKEHEYDKLKFEYNNVLNSQDTKAISLFEMNIENIKTDISDEQRQAIEKVFSEVSTDYAVLNLVKLEERKESEEVDNNVISKIKKLDFSRLPLFYGNILYYLIKRNYSLSEILRDLKLTRIKVYLDYFIKAYPDYHNTALEYIRSNPTKNLMDARINREIEKYALVLEKLEEEDFRYMLERYIDDGTYHITGIYHPDIIENEIVSEIKEDDEVFLMYLYKARKIKESNPVEYVRYLKKAIKVFPFRKAIEVLQEEIEKQLNPPVNDEMVSLKKQFKENIKVLIAGNMLDQAEAVINQYEQIINEDLEILFFKSQIALMRSEEKDYR